MKATKSSRRFTSEKSANNFSKEVKGTVKDLRDCKESKSNFKVTYNKIDAKNRDFTNESHSDEYWE
jgi:maltodextrin utilization protein YvdJ